MLAGTTAVVGEANMGEAHLWTWEDIVHLPETEQPEIIGGRPFARATPRGTHGRIVGKLYAQVDRADGVGLRDGWWISIDPCVRLSPHAIVGPDLAGWRKANLPELPDDWPLDVRPDWVCEVLSPGNAHYDRNTKAQLYASAGIPWYWLVDPTERYVEVLELDADKWRIHGCFAEGEVPVLPPFGEFAIDVGQLFLPRKPAV
ncbi:MAG: Uma2 family endonuclease [Deltaproteobacteria bacterium]|nr:Uma2 family endonuclease [Deltaproteobacteria bacterium]